MESLFIVCGVFISRFSLWAVLFVLGRLLTLILSVLTFGFGLARAEDQQLNFSTGNFNILAVRYSKLGTVLKHVLQTHVKYTVSLVWY